MKILLIASFALLLIGETSRAMLPGMSESGRHIRSLPVIGSQTQDQGYQGDIVAPQNGPMLAPFMPWHHPSENGPMLAFVPWKPPQNGIMLAPFMPWKSTSVC